MNNIADAKQNIHQPQKGCIIIMALSTVLEENINYIESRLPVHASFDLMTRHLYLGETKAYFLGVNGFCKTEILQQIFSDLQNPMYVRNGSIEDIRQYMNGKIGYEIGRAHV